LLSYSPMINPIRRLAHQATHQTIKYLNQLYIDRMKFWPPGRVHDPLYTKPGFVVVAEQRAVRPCDAWS